MKFKQYAKESKVSSNKILLDEGFFDNDYNIDRPSFVQDEIDDFFGPVRKLISDGEYDAARKMLTELEDDLNELEAENSKKKFFKFPQFMINGQRKKIDALKARLPKNESVEDMNKRCEVCNTLLNDSGSCPKCDDGEEDYEDKIEEDLSVRAKLKAAYPELNFENTSEKNITEALSNKEKLLRAYPELNFDKSDVTEKMNITEDMSVREKLKAAYPELNFDSPVTESIVEDIEEYADYDDNYDLSCDDVEMDARHASLYGGDRMYCDCGCKLHYNEYGSYCPDCEPDEIER